MATSADRWDRNLNRFWQIFETLFAITLLVVLVLAALGNVHPLAVGGLAWALLHLVRRAIDRTAGPH